MKRLMLFVSVSLLFISACKKSDTVINDPLKESVLDYMPLKIGNYWVYEFYQFDSGEVNNTFLRFDTTSITKDTLINNYTYFKLESGINLFTNPVFLRDSGNYIVDNNGRVWFTHVDSINIFNENLIEDNNGDTVYYWHERLTTPNAPVVVNAGIFPCLDMLTFFYREEDSLQIAHNVHRYYAKNVGIVKETTIFGATLIGYKRELLKYHLEE